MIKATSTVAIIALAVLAYQMIVAYSHRISSGYADSAGFMELVGKNGLTEPLKSQYFASVQQLFSLYQESPDRICALIPKSLSGSTSVFSGHPYLISVVGSLVSWLTNLQPDLVAALLILGSTFMGLGAIIVFLKKNQVSYFMTGLFVFLICCYPVLTHSLLGQPYFDRLMFGPGVTVFLLVWWTKYKSLMPWRWICFSTIVLALISERGAALAGLISVGYLFVLHGTKIFTQRELRYILASGSLSLFYTFWWSRYMQATNLGGKIDYRRFGSRLEFLFHQPNLEATKTLFIVSATFLLLSLFSGRGFLLVAISLFPNLLIGVGGAELNVFLTHYHQVYLPVLLAASAIAVVKVSKLIRRMNNQFMVKTLGIALIAIFSIISFNFSFSRVPPVFGINTLDDAATLWFPSSHFYDGENKKNISTAREIATYVKTQGLNVSAPESWYPILLLSGVDEVQYWPFGVGTADVIIVPYVEGELNVLPHSDPQGSTQVLRSCVQSELEKHYVMKRKIDNNLMIYTKID